MKSMPNVTFLCETLQLVNLACVTLLYLITLNSILRILRFKSIRAKDKLSSQILFYCAIKMCFWMAFEMPH